jgi:hypothetical protein
MLNFLLNLVLLAQTSSLSKESELDVIQFCSMCHCLVRSKYTLFFKSFFIVSDTLIRLTVYICQIHFIHVFLVKYREITRQKNFSWKYNAIKKYLSKSIKMSSGFNTSNTCFFRRIVRAQCCWCNNNVQISPSCIITGYCLHFNRL